MRKFLMVLLVVVMLVSVCVVFDAYAKSSENKADCKAWCNDNKPRCEFCDSNAFCGGSSHDPRHYDVIKSFKKGTGNWYACGLSKYGLNSRENERQCKEWCDKNEECEKCTSGVCGKGIKLLRRFSSSGKNWYACQKTNWARNTEKSKAEAEKWCEDYTKSSGEDCRIVKSGKSCPDGFYKSDRLKVSWGRDFKVCLASKSGTQRVKDCTPQAVKNIEKSLAWINTHDNTILTGFQLQPREYRNDRARERYDRKFPQVTVICEDHRNKCKKRSMRGWSAAGRKIHLCYSNHKNFCQLVGTIFHEAAHNAWVDDQVSQHIGDPGSQDDTVYQLGYRAEDLCYGNNDRGSNILPTGTGTNYNFPF